MPLINHEGGSEASYDKGEKYKGRVEEYLRARDYSIERRSNHHSTTEDLAAIGVEDDFHCLNGEKVGDEFKKFVRVEAKGGDLSRLDESFLTELARVFIDFCEQDGGFEYHVYAANLQAPRKWQSIFDPRQNSDEGVEDYFEQIVEDHGLNEREEEVFRQYDVEDFEWFLADVFVHQASWDRLGQMAEDERSVDRSKWDFYARENPPYREPETLVANFLHISGYPEYVYIGECLADHPEEIYNHNPRYLPIWVEGGILYSLIPDEDMEESLLRFVDEESIQRQEFDRWLREEGANATAKKLFNRYVRQRVVEDYDGCRMVRHQYENRLIFEHDPENDGDDGPSQTKVDGWVVTMERGKYVGHRYAAPQVRRYEDAFYVFVETGWLFSHTGRGNNIADGDLASRLHDELQSDGYYRPNNLKAQFRQWRSYLGLDEGEFQTRVPSTGDGDPLSIGFTEVNELEIRKRPPKDTSERALLMERGVDSY